MIDDAELLRGYVEGRSEEAFTEFVRRHLNLVYFAALRRTAGNGTLAEDIAQYVFTEAARTAPALVRHVTVTGWLYTTTRFAAAKMLRAERARKRREQENSFMHNPSSDSSVEWEQLRPFIDGALDGLRQRDREALLLRFFEGRQFADIGAALHISEDAARMRVERALAKLHAALSRRGVTSTRAALGLVLGHQAAFGAPAGLVGSVSSAALAGTSTAAWTAMLSALMAPKLIITTAAIALAAFVTVHFANNAGGSSTASSSSNIQPNEPSGVSAQAAATSQEVTGSGEPAEPVNSVPTVLSETAPAPTIAAPAPALSPTEIETAVMHNLRQIAASRARFILEHRRAPESINELVGPDSYIKRLISVAGESYASLGMGEREPLRVTTPDGITVTYEEPASPPPVVVSPEMLRFQSALNRARVELGRPVSQAIAAFRQANRGAQPWHPQDLVPYFSSVSEAADFVEFIEQQGAAKR